MPSEPQDASVSHDPEQQRYELTIDGVTAIAEYRLADGSAAFTHTLVPPQLEGKGVGSRLIAGALSDVRRRGLKVRPLCPFVKHYIEKHQEFRDLLAD